MRPHASVCIPLAFAFASCASAPKAELPPLTRLAQHESEGRAGLSGEGLPAPQLSLLDEPREEAALGGFQVRARFAALEPDAARRLVGWQMGDGAAWSTNLEEVERALAACRAEGQAELRSSSAVWLAPGEPLRVQLIDQLAYVKSFQFELTDGVLTADPVVATFTEGLSLTGSARPGAEQGRTALELDLQLVKLQRPIPALETGLIGPATKLSVQQPLASSQELRTAAELAPEECLVLVRPALDGTDRLLFVFVAARPVGARTAAHAPSESDTARREPST